jgi:hypothetical protein
MAARRLAAWCENPATATKPGWTPPDTIPLGHLNPAGEQAMMSVSEFIGLLLDHEAAKLPDPTITSTRPVPIGGSQ